MQLIGIEKKDYHIIGRLLVNRDPQRARQLLSSFPRAAETDISKAKYFFSAFCNCLQIKPEYISGPEVKNSKQVEMQRLFICLILKLYVPYVFEMDLKNQQVRQGLTENISKIIHQKRSNVSMMIRQSIVREKAYEDFRDKVNCIIEFIYHGKAEA